jgi:hypothetical protein
LREIYEFRIPEERAAAVLPPDAGEVLGGTVRKVEVPGDAPLFEAIRRGHEVARAAGEFFHASWSVRRSSTAAEVRAASLFLVRPRAVTEQAGEPAGGAPGAVIALDTRKLPKKDFVTTLAGEHLVGQRVADMVLDAGLTGVELRRVRHRERMDEQEIALSKVPAGRRLLERAEAAGHPHPGWGFWVWLNRPEQQPLLQAATEEHRARTQPGRRRRETASVPWYQLVMVSRQVPTVLPTRFGIDPFDDDDAGEYRDRASRVAGLNILSPCYVAEEAWDGSDFVETREKVGRKAGLLRPVPLLLASARVHGLFAERGIKGIAFEVAHLVRNGEPTFRGC